MRRWFKVAVPVGVAVVLVSVMAIGFGSTGIDAAPGGNGNGNGHGRDKGSATLWTEPANPYPAYGFDFMVRGSGFNPDSTVHASFSSNGSCCLTFNVSANSNGEISFPWTTGAPGTYTFHAYQDMKGHKWSIWAEVKVEVTDQ